MGRLLVEGGPPEEPVEQSAVSPDALRKVVGNPDEPDYLDKLVALEQMDPFPLGILTGRRISGVSPNVPDLVLYLNGKRTVIHFASPI